MKKYYHGSISVAITVALLGTYSVTANPNFVQEVVAEEITTPVTELTESDQQATVVGMFNTIQGLNVIVDNVLDGTVNKYYFDGVDVTAFVEDMVDSGFIKVIKDGTRTIFVVPSEQPFLGEHEFGIELFDGTVISEKFVLEQPQQPQRSTRAVTLAPTLVSPSDSDDSRQSISLKDLKFSWNTVSTATAYRIVISEDSTFTCNTI